MGSVKENLIAARAYSDWHAAGVELFGPDELLWRFVCPSCGHVASPSDWKAAGAPEGAVAFSCVGRWMPETKGEIFAKSGPCNYAGGGLFGLNPVRIVQENGKEHRIFAFADRAIPSHDEKGAGV